MKLYDASINKCCVAITRSKNGRACPGPLLNIKALDPYMFSQWVLQTWLMQQKWTWERLIERYSATLLEASRRLTLPCWKGDNKSSMIKATDVSRTLLQPFYGRVAKEQDQWKLDGVAKCIFWLHWNEAVKSTPPFFDHAFSVFKLYNMHLFFFT